MAIIDFRHAAERLKDFGFRLRPERVYIRISDAKVNLQNGSDSSLALINGCPNMRR